MVKNSFGGNRAKSFARKSSHSSIRFPSSPFELFAVVKKIFGGSICSVLSQDNLLRNSVIRGKFRGSSKRHNFISIGSIVLIGIRDWSTSNDSDILEVYSSSDLDSLKLFPSFPSHLLSINTHHHHHHHDDEEDDGDGGFEISNKKNQDVDKDEEKKDDTDKDKKDTDKDEDKDEEIDIDEI